MSRALTDRSPSTWKSSAAQGQSSVYRPQSFVGPPVDDDSTLATLPRDYVSFLRLVNGAVVWGADCTSAVAAIVRIGTRFCAYGPAKTDCRRCIHQSRPLIFRSLRTASATSSSFGPTSFGNSMAKPAQLRTSDLPGVSSSPQLPPTPLSSFRCNCWSASKPKGVCSIPDGY